MEKIEIVDYTEKYNNELMQLQINQWGEGSDSDEIINNIDKYNCKLALNSNKNLIGTLIFHKKDNFTLYLDMIVITPNYQKIGIGTRFMEIVINYAIENKFKKIECEAIEANGHINSQKLLEKYVFIKTKTIKNYWGKQFPNFKCKECGNIPCTCTMHKYFKYF